MSDMKVENGLAHRLIPQTQNGHAQKLATPTSPENGHVEELPPPTNQKMEIRDKFSLVLELIWANILIIPCILFNFFRMIFPQEKSLKGQVVLVTGAGRGLGRGLALGFAREGCKVAVADVNKANALEVAEEIIKGGGTAKAYFTNVAKPEEVNELEKAIKQDLGAVDILVNNAGLVHGGKVEEMEDNEITAMISVNLTSHFWMLRAFLPEMKKRNSGHIVAIASMSGLTPIANALPYVTTKFGVRGFMDAVRVELAKIPNNNIKTTTVYPYFINTSALYVDHWNNRIPPISIEEAVATTITSVKREELNVTIPQCYRLMLFLRLLPQYIQDKMNDALDINIIPPNREELDTTPAAVIMRGLSS